MTMTAPKKDLYEILDISPVATQEEIKSAYRALARRYHPDSGDATASADRFQEIHADNILYFVIYNAWHLFVCFPVN